MRRARRKREKPERKKTKEMARRARRAERERERESAVKTDPAVMMGKVSGPINFQQRYTVSGRNNVLIATAPTHPHQVIGPTTSPFSTITPHLPSRSK